MIRPGWFRARAAEAFAVAALLAPACGRPSDELRIRELLQETVALAENNDAAGIMEFFAPDYQDFEGRDAAGTRQLVTGYLDRYRNVVIHLLGARIGAVGADRRVSVECEVSLSHGAAEVLRKLIRYTGEYYRFGIDLRESERGEWRFTYAEWRSIGLADVFPESLAILKELFPDL